MGADNLQATSDSTQCDKAACEASQFVSPQLWGPQCQQVRATQHICSPRGNGRLVPSLWKQRLPDMTKDRKVVICSCISIAERKPQGCDISAASDTKADERGKTLGAAVGTGLGGACARAAVLQARYWTLPQKARVEGNWEQHSLELLPWTARHQHIWLQGFNH